MAEQAQQGSAAVRSGYRKDIDGLRAIAVLLVLACHLNTRVAGGFVGVDVFFVISGYLISSHILKEMEEGRFSLVTFYERRVRRIFPALLVMLAVITLLTWRYFTPSELESYGRSLLAALLSVSNLQFWHEAGYFDGASTLKPLLHTWSLGVEEQFYIFFPLLLVVLRRYLPTRLRVSIYVLTAVSLVAAAVCAYRAPEAAFFFSPLRAWELLFGTILSQHYLPQMRTSLQRNLATFTGLLLILGPAFLYNPSTHFPGLAAIPPVLGSVLIIGGGETGTSVVGSLLSLRPVVFIGLISYSLYLWHWPLIVMQNTSSLIFRGELLTTLHKLLFSLICIAIGTLSWAFVEQPFRAGRFRPSRNQVFAINGVAVAALSVLAFALVATHGLPARFSPEAQRIADFERADEQSFRTGQCFLATTNRFADFDQAFCLPATGKPALLILGDSHAAELWTGMSKVFGPDHDVRQANVFSCRPWLPAGQANMPDACRKMADFLFQQYLPQHRDATVVLAGRWYPYEMPKLERTIAYLHGLGIKAVVIGPSIEYDMPQPRVIALALRAQKPDGIAAHRQLEPEELDRTMATLARERWHVGYISYYDDLCRPACPIYAGHDPLLMDDNHLTPAGSELFAATIRQKGQLD